jgi:hypothetical protein
MVLSPTPEIALQDLTREIVRLLPEYLSGVSTGSAALTEGRTCWIKAWKALLTAMGRERSMEMDLHEDGDSALARQLTLYWKTGDGIMAFPFRLGRPEELDRRFQTLETIKAPRKIFVYSCVKWQSAVLEQLGAALLRYPHHIEGEQYLALNLLGSEQKVAAHSIWIPRNGNFQPGDLEQFLPLPGSPYRWGDRPLESR